MSKPPQKKFKIIQKIPPPQKKKKKNHPKKVLKNFSKQVYLLTYGNAESLFERETRIIILCVLTYIGPIAECAYFSAIMYWSAHVGTQENGCHDVWYFSYKMIAYTFPLIPLSYRCRKINNIESVQRSCIY